MKEKDGKEELKEQIRMVELDMISKGVRPEWMDQQEFRIKRKALQRLEKRYKQGKIVYLSKEIVEETDEKTKEVQKLVKTYAPYVRTTPRRHETKNGTTVDTSVETT